MCSGHYFVNRNMTFGFYTFILPCTKVQTRLRQFHKEGGSKKSCYWHVFIDRSLLKRDLKFDHVTNVKFCMPLSIDVSFIPSIHFYDACFTRLLNRCHDSQLTVNAKIDNSSRMANLSSYCNWHRGKYFVQDPRTFQWCIFQWWNRDERKFWKEHDRIGLKYD